MDMNIIVAGVGGQGILSIAFVLDNAAMKEGYHFKQAEVHGMSQRGGAVQSHMRFSKNEIFSDLIPEGMADLILSVEPLESLRYVHYLKADGTVVTSASPYVNIPNYPDLEGVYARVAKLKDHALIDSEGLAKLAGSPKAQNMVILGAAASLLPFDDASCLEYVEQLFKAKGEKLVQVNKIAFRYGKAISDFFRAGIKLGLDPDLVRRFCTILDPEQLEPDSWLIWKNAFEKHPGLLDQEREKPIPGTIDGANQALATGQI